MKKWEILRLEAQKRGMIRERLEKNGNHDFVGEFREGVAPVRDGRDWYHVDAENKPIYSNRFIFAGIFSGGIAQVRDSSGWFHIYRDATEAYQGRACYGETGLLRAFLKARESSGLNGPQHTAEPINGHSK